MDFPPQNAYCTGRIMEVLVLPLTAIVRFVFPESVMSLPIVTLTIDTPTMPEAAPAQSGVVARAPKFTVTASATRKSEAGVGGKPSTEVRVYGPSPVL